MIELAFLGLGVLFIVAAIAQCREHWEEEKRFEDLVDRVIRWGDGEK